MNKWLLGVAMLLSSLFSYAQSPQAMNFQAVARNAGGNPISDKEVGIKIEIVQGSASGTTVYGETHHTTTAKNGVVNLQIGNGTAINGIFTEIDWSQSPITFGSAWTQMEGAIIRRCQRHKCSPFRMRCMRRERER